VNAAEYKTYTEYFLACVKRAYENQMRDCGCSDILLVPYGEDYKSPSINNPDRVGSRKWSLIESRLKSRYCYVDGKYVDALDVLPKCDKGVLVCSDTPTAICMNDGTVYLVLRYSSKWDFYYDEALLFGVNGVDQDGYNYKGMDSSGYDEDGYDANGYNEEGYDREGYDKNGYDINGYDREGFDKKGYDSDGYGRDGYCKEGYNRDGYYKKDIEQNGEPTVRFCGGKTQFTDDNGKTIVEYIGGGVEFLSTPKKFKFKNIPSSGITFLDGNEDYYKITITGYEKADYVEYSSALDDEAFELEHPELPYGLFNGGYSTAMVSKGKAVFYAQPVYDMKRGVSYIKIDDNTISDEHNMEIVTITVKPVSYEKVEKATRKQVKSGKTTYELKLGDTLTIPLNLKEMTKCVEMYENTNAYGVKEWEYSYFANWDAKEGELVISVPDWRTELIGKETEIRIYGICSGNSTTIKIKHTK